MSKIINKKAPPRKIKADKTVKRVSSAPVDDRLHSLNKWLAIAYGTQALALLLFSLRGLFPVTVHFLGVDTLASQATGHTVYAAATLHLFDMSLPQLLALSLAISAATCGILARWLRAPYAVWVKQGSNPIRWMDGSFSTSLIPVAIGLVVGLSDVTSLLMLFVLGFATHILGLYMEAYNAEHMANGQPAKDYRPFILLCITSAAVWLTLGVAILSSVIFGSGLPTGAWTAYGIGTFCVGAYGFILLQGYRRRGRWANYRTSDLACSLLSFAAKSTIAWLLFWAVLTR